MSERRLTHEEMSSDVDRNSASSQANGLKRREGFMMEVVKIAEVIVNFFEVCMFCRSKKNETITPFFLITSYYSRSHMRNWMITAWMARIEWLRSSTWRHQFWNSNLERMGGWTLCLSIKEEYWYVRTFTYSICILSRKIYPLWISMNGNVSNP